MVNEAKGVNKISQEQHVHWEEKGARTDPKKLQHLKVEERRHSLQRRVRRSSQRGRRRGGGSANEAKGKPREAMGQRVFIRVD